MLLCAYLKFRTQTWKKQEIHLSFSSCVCKCDTHTEVKGQPLVFFLRCHLPLIWDRIFYRAQRLTGCSGSPSCFGWGGMYEYDVHRTLCWGPRVILVSFSIALHLRYWDGSLSSTLEGLFSCPAQLSKKQKKKKTSYRFWGSNSGCYPYKASTLPLFCPLKPKDPLLFFPRVYPSWSLAFVCIYP